MVTRTTFAIPFHLGYRSDIDPLLLPNGATADCANVLFDRQSLRVRPGFTQVMAVPEHTRQIAEFDDPARTPAVGLLAVAGTEVLVTGSDGAFATAQSLNTTVDAARPVRMAQYGEALYLVDGAPGTPVKKLLVNPSNPTVVVPLTETAAPGGAPAVVVDTPAGTLTGTCQFAYSFAHAIVGATLISESALSPTGSITLTGAGSVLVTTATTTPEDYINLYLLDGGVWRLVAQRQVTTRIPGQTFSVTAPPAVDAPSYAPAATVPPAGCTLLAAHANRMWYAKGDTLYISNLDTPELAPQSLTISADPTSGGFIRISDDGSPITALCPFGSYLMVFTARGLWRVDGAPGAPTFAVTPITRERGALSHEGVCVVEGNLLCWLEAGGVWAWDGRSFFEIGRPVRGAWAGVAASDQAASALVYDADERLLMLFVHGAPTTPLAGTALLCSVTQPVDRATDGTPLYAWGIATGLPHALARPLHLTSSGIYAVDMRSGATALYRMNSGADDAGQPIAWHWQDRRRMDPDPTAYKNVRRLQVLTGQTVPAAVTVTLDPGITGLTTSKTLDQFPAARAAWTPPALPDSPAYQVTLNGAGQAGEEITGLLVDISLRGRITR